MCEKCENGGNILDGYLETTKGEVFTRLRFDLDNNQFDMQFGTMGEDTPDEYEWTHSIDISFCPFCGRRLPISLTEDDFVKFLNPVGKTDSLSNTEKALLFIVASSISEFHTSDNEVLRMLTNKFGTEVVSFNKEEKMIVIRFKEPVQPFIQKNIVIK